MELLGKTAEDRITGFRGVITGYVTYPSGCNQALVVPRIGTDGKLVEPQWFDEQRLTLDPAPALVLDNAAAPGFDKQAPKR